MTNSTCSPCASCTRRRASVTKAQAPINEAPHPARPTALSAAQTPQLCSSCAPCRPAVLCRHRTGTAGPVAGCVRARGHLPARVRRAKHVPRAEVLWQPLRTTNSSVLIVRDKHRFCLERCSWIAGFERQRPDDRCKRNHGVPGAGACVCNEAYGCVSGYRYLVLVSPRPAGLGNRCGLKAVARRVGDRVIRWYSME